VAVVVLHPTKGVGIGAQAYTASGMVLSQGKNARVLTAGHVCAPPEVPPPTVVVDMVSEMTVYDSAGMRHTAKVLRIDKANDLCLLEVPHIRGRPMVLARAEPSKHARVYTVGAPMGAWSPDGTVVFEGHYVGHHGDDSVYSIPAAPGSSGSPIVNGRGQLVGMVSRGLPPNWHVVYSPTLEAIRAFVEHKS